MTFGPLFCASLVCLCLYRNAAVVLLICASHANGASILAFFCVTNEKVKLSKEL